MKKWWRQPLMLVFLAAFTLTARAGDLKLAIVDTQVLIDKSPEITKITRALKHRNILRRAKIMQLQEKLQNEVEELKENAVIMTIEERAALEKKVITDRNNIQTMKADLNKDISKQKKEILDDFSSKVKEVVSRLAANKHIDLVLQKRKTWYAKNDLDLTEDVLKALP